MTNTYDTLISLMRNAKQWKLQIFGNLEIALRWIRETKHYDNTAFQSIYYGEVWP